MLSRVRGDFMKVIMEKLIYPIIVTTILGGYAAWRSNDTQTKENAVQIKKIEENINKTEKVLGDRLTNLESFRGTMPDYYVTRREFNKILELQDEKLEKINSNVEKLIDLQLRK